MNAVELYKLCKECGLHLSVERADLRLSATRGVIPERIKAMVRTHKQALIALLTEHQAPSQSSLPNTQGEPVLSYAQQRLWFQHLYDRQSAVYNVPLVLESRTKLDVVALRASLRSLIERHEPLRTAIRNDNDEGVAAPYLLDAQNFQIVDHGEAGDGDALAEQLTAAQTGKAFDLAVDFMIRADLMHRNGRGSLLFLTMHHIAVDGWSLELIVDELNDAYDAFSRGDTPAVEPLPHRFSDYAVWQQSQLHEESIDGHIGHWKRRLAGIPELHRFPVDKPRPATPSHRGDRHRFALDAATSGALRALATDHGCTIFSAIQAVFAVFVARYSDSADVLFGTPVANRALSGTAGIVGYLANVVPLRTRIAPGASFQDVLKQTSTDFVADLPHHSVPMEMLIDALQLPRRVSHNPLLQMMLVFEESGQEGTKGDTRSTLVRSAQCRIETGSKFDLSLIARSSSDGLVFAWEYASDLFDSATMPRLAANFVQLLRSIVAMPQCPVAELQLLCDEERALLSRIGSGPSRAVEDIAVHRLFERQVRAKPEATALVCADITLSYRALDEQANALAHTLVKRGVGRNDIVGICLHHPRAFPVAALATMKAGAAYLPMDPGYPALRIEHIVRDSGARIWLSDGESAALADRDVTVIDIDTILASKAQRPRQAPNTEVAGEDLAYMIYTSGSTGLPKGTLLEHRGAVNLALAHSALFELDDKGQSRPRILQFSSISFDAATWELLIALCNGASLVVPDPEERLDPAAVARLLERQRVTHAILPPVYLAAFERDSLPTLRHLIVGGAAIGLAEARKWSQDRRFHNAYGPTETTVCATIGEYCGEDRVHMGGPIANHRCEILDANGRRVPLGAVGELYLSGIGLARSYHNNPELTGERFTLRSVDGGPVERWYRSGDLVRWLPNGQIEYQGRVDQQVKIRGFRVELGEVEAALASHPDVTAVHAKAWQGGGHDESRLVVYFVLGDEVPTAQSRSRMREFMEQRVPDYMVPVAYVPMTALPLTAHGKVDAAALPCPGEGDSVQHEYVAPRTDAEHRVCEVLGELLPQTRVGLRDNFYALGGDSILSIRAVARINAHGYRITSRQFFEARTVEGIAALLEADTSAGAGFDQAASDGVLELLPIQRRFLALRDGYEDRFLQSALLHVPNSLDEAFFATFLPEFYARHDLLRLRLGELDSPQPKAWFQPVDQTDPLAAFAFENLSGLDKDQRLQRIETVGDACKSAISITRGRLFSMVLFDADQPDDRRLLMVFHHLIVDGVSWRIVLDDLALALAQYERGESIQLSAKATGFQEWSRRLAEWCSAEGKLEAQAHWPATAACEGNVEDGAVGTLADTQRVTATLDVAETSALLQDSHNAYRTQINDLLLAALAMALVDWNGAGHHDVHLESHGRDDGLFDDIDLGQCLGWFTSLYPVRLAAHGIDEEGLRATILHTKQVLRRVPHLGLSYLYGDRLTIRPAIVFNYLGQFDQQMGQTSRFTRAPEATGFDVDRRRHREYGLGFNGHVTDGRLSFQIDFDGRHFGRGDAARLATAFERALRRVLVHCRQQTRSWASPPDFPLCAVTQVDIDRWQSEFGDIENLYPASGNQLGMLYHAQLEGSSSYSTQNLVRFPSDFDATAFKRAWDWVVRRHSVLRTVFVGLDREQSLQLVLRDINLVWHEQDLGPLPAKQQQAAIDTYLRDDIQRPLDPRHAPLARFALFQVDAGQTVFVWSCSHAILDGWSLGVVYRDMLIAYEALREGRKPIAPAVAEYHSYIEWVQQHSGKEARAFWSRELTGTAPAEPVVGIETSAAASAGKHSLRHTLAKADHAALQEFAARHGITVSTIAQAAWAFLLGRYGNRDCVTTGITLSGRPAELPGVEDIVGLMVNTVPAVVPLVRDQSLVDWLQYLHERQCQREIYGYLPLSEIVKLAAMDEGQAVFDTVLGFHSQPVEQAASAMHKAGITGGVGHENTHYPLVLGVSPHTSLQFTLTYDTSRFTREAMQRLFIHLDNVLKALVSPQHRTVGDLDLLPSAERTQLATLAEGPAPQHESLSVPELIAHQAAARGDAPALLLEE
uniref:non-ribosomal peptide synthetase n=1 Tax=Microbulbifer litoralis TaxID=2933965 RepID=UPI002028B7D3